MADRAGEGETGRRRADQGGVWSEQSGEGSRGGRRCGGERKVGQW